MNFNLKDCLTTESHWRLTTWQFLQFIVAGQASSGLRC